MIRFHSIAATFAALLAAAGLAAGCGSGSTTETLENDGTACLSNPSGDSNGVDPGGTEVTVTFDTCLSSSCDTVTDKNCEVAVEGDDVVVDSAVTIESDGGACTDDCGRATVTCEGPELEAGDYTLTHGEALQAFSLPSSDEVCTGESPF